MQELTKEAAQKIARQYLQEGADPTEQMVKTAEKHDLTAQQIQPIARRANRKILVQLQKQGVQDGGDPHATFPTIDPDRVVMIIRQEGGTLPDEPTATAPDDTPSDASETLDAIFGTGDDSASCGTVGYSLDDYQEEPSAIPNEDMALRVLNKAEEAVEQKKRKLTQVEMKLEEALHKLQKQATRYLQADHPVEPLEDLPGVSATIDKARQKVASVHHVTEPYELKDNHPFMKLADRINQLRDDCEDAEYEWELTKNKARDYKRAIKDEGWL